MRPRTFGQRNSQELIRNEWAHIAPSAPPSHLMSLDDSPDSSEARNFGPPPTYEEAISGSSGRCSDDRWTRRNSRTDHFYGDVESRTSRCRRSHQDNSNSGNQSRAIHRSCRSNSSDVGSRSHDLGQTRSRLSNKPNSQCEAGGMGEPKKKSSKIKKGLENVAFGIIALLD